MQCGIDRADLEQVAAIGLIKAADRFDESQGTPFEAYAWLLVVGEVMHFARDGAPFVRAPRGLRQLERRWTTAQRELRTQFGREPADGEVAQRVGAQPAQAHDVRTYQAGRTVLSFELLARCEDPAAADAFDRLLDRLTIKRMLLALTPLEREIVISIHLQDISVVDVARRLGYSRRHVTRLHRTALQRLKRAGEVSTLRGGEARGNVSLPYRG
jgi:RNA polymerase sigma-B factor